MISLICVKECVNQDTGKRVYPDLKKIVKVSEMEASRHLAEGNMILPQSKEKYEKRILTPMETRKGEVIKKRKYKKKAIKDKQVKS